MRQAVSNSHMDANGISTFALLFFHGLAGIALSFPDHADVSAQSPADNCTGLQQVHPDIWR